MNEHIKVGAKVRRDGWYAVACATVTYVGKSFFLAEEHGVETVHLKNDDSFVPYVEPVVYPEGWANVYDDHIAGWCALRTKADIGARPERIGVLHLKSDGTTEMEQP